MNEVRIPALPKLLSMSPLGETISPADEIPIRRRVIRLNYVDEGIGCQHGSPVNVTLDVQIATTAASVSSARLSG